MSRDPLVAVAAEACSDSELACAVHERCGGCPQITLSRREQQRDKAQRLERQLGELGFAELPMPWVAVPAPAGYRNRLRFRFDAGVPQLFNPEKPLACAVLEPTLRRELNRFFDWASRRPEVFRGFAHAELRAPDLDGIPGLSLTPLPGPGAPPKAPEVPAMSTWVRGQGLPPMQRWKVTEQSYTYLPLSSFCQVNTELNARLLAQTSDVIEQLGCRRFADLYCGAGNLSLPLLARGLQGAGVEREPNAVLGLRRAAAEQGFDASRFVSGQAQDWAARAGHFDVLLVDPPRAGMGTAAATIAALGASHVVLWSCVASSFCRDAVALRTAGYELRRLWLGDMFPHTEHMEVVGVLSRLR